MHQIMHSLKFRTYLDHFITSVLVSLFQSIQIFPVQVPENEDECPECLIRFHSKILSQPVHLNIRKHIDKETQR